MFKKLLTLAAVAFVAYSANAAEPVTLWQADDAEGVLVDWGQPCFVMSADEVNDLLQPGDYVSMTISGVTEGGWPQVALFASYGGWPPLINSGVGGQTYPYVVTFPITYDIFDTLTTEGLSFSGNGAYVSEVSYTKGIEITRNTVWFGEKACNWGNGVSVAASTFANVHEGDQLKYWISDASCQVLLGGWSGLNLPAYAAGSESNPYSSYVDGVYTLNMVEKYATTNDYDGNELDVFALMKANGVVMHGPTTITRIDYIPDPWVAKSVGHATTYYANGNFAPAEDLNIKMYDGAVVIKAWAGAEGYDLKVAFDEEDNVTAVTPIVNGVEGQTVTRGYASVPTGIEEYYQAQFYVGSGYANAGYDEEGGYVLFYYGYFYESQDADPVEKYYYVEWPLSAEELMESIPAEYDADVETVQGLYTTYKEIEDYFPGYAAVAGDEMSAIAQEITGLFQEVEDAMMNAAEEWGYVSPLDEEVIAGLNEKLEALKTASEAAYDTLLAEMAETEADITELEEAFNAIKEEAEANFAGYLTLKAEEVAAIEEGLAAINEAYNAAEDEAKNVTGVWAGVPMSLMTPTTEQVMSLVAEFEPTLEAILDAYNVDVETINSQAMFMQKFPAMLEESFPGYLVLAADEIAAINAQLVELSNKVEEALGEAAMTGVYAGPEAEIAEVVARVDALMEGADDALMAIIIASEEDDEALWDLDSAINGLAEEFENFPAYLATTQDELAEIQEAYDALYEQYEDAMMTAMFTGVYEGISQADLMAVTEALLGYVSAGAEALAAIDNGYDADLENIMQNYVSYVEDAQENDALSAEAKAAAKVVDDKAFDVILSIEDAYETALELTAEYKSPVKESDIEALDAALAAFKALCPTTGINGIANGNADVKYYDLNGTNVENPVAGKVYIRVAGGNATKVLVK